MASETSFENVDDDGRMPGYTISSPTSAQNVTNTNVSFTRVTIIFVKSSYLSKLALRKRHTRKNVIYSCEFFTHVWQIGSVKNKVKQGSVETWMRDSRSKMW